MEANRADYESLDRSTEGWTTAEHSLGEYEVLGD